MAVALVHAIAMAATLTIADLGRNFPHGPSRVGRVLGVWRTSQALRR